MTTDAHVLVTALWWSALRARQTLRDLRRPIMPRRPVAPGGCPPP